MVGFERHGARDLHHRHVGKRLEQVDQMTLVVGGEVDDDHHGEAAIAGQGGEQPFQCREAARGRADRDDGDGNSVVGDRGRRWHDLRARRRTLGPTIRLG